MRLMSLLDPDEEKFYVSNIPGETTDFAFVLDSVHVTTYSGINQRPTMTCSKCVCFNNNSSIIKGKQQYIPVGCVPPARYRTGGGGGVSVWGVQTQEIA